MTIFECDGCKKQVPKANGRKPDDWYCRTDIQTKREYHACSRPCIKDVSKKEKTTAVIVPL